MRILLLADKPERRLWDELDRRKLEGVDLILSCGDLPASYLSFLTCFTQAPILYVHGNHDVRYEKDPPEGCICIEDTIYVHEGVRILGLGGCMIGNVNPEKVRETLELEERFRPVLVIALGKPDETVVLTELKPGESFNYYRDENDVHYVPKRPLDEIIIK